MPKALICTVGTVFEGRENILDVLAKEIRAITPDYLVFVVSQESKLPAQKVAERASLAQCKVEYLELEAAHDLNEVFARTNDAIRRLLSAGFSAADISVNYTSGTKVMGAGVVLAAVFNQCNQLRYIYEGAGHADRIITTRPEAVIAFRDLLMGTRLIEELRFQSASDVLARIDSSMLSDYDVSVLEALRKIACGYYAWDNFNPAVFVECMQDVPRTLEPVSKFLVDSGTLALLAQLASDQATEQYTPILFADMVNNAVRRIFEGKMDDAVARLYRALEMLAQWVLRNRYGIDTDDLDTRRVPPRYRPSFEAMRSLDDGTVRIGMRKAYELLAHLEAPLGLRFQQNRVMGELLRARSKSILAHGTRRMQESDCQNLLQEAVDLFTSEIPDFAQTCIDLQFPWLRERTKGLLASKTPSE